MGRQSKRTPENKEKILKLLRSGACRKNAYEAFMTGETFAQWMKADAQFAEEVREAEATYGATLELLAFTSAKGNLVVSEQETTTYFADGGVKSKTKREDVKPPSDTMLMFLLERRFPDDYGRKDQLKLIPPEKLSHDQLATELGALLERLGIAPGSPPPGLDGQSEGGEGAV